MKKYFIAAACLACLTACGGKNNDVPTDAADSTTVEATKVGGIVEDTPWHDENTVAWNGHTYQYTLDRAADKSLPTVKNELGQPYYDNSITLSVKRDGEVFFARKFTKEAFANFLSDDYKTNASLLGLAFDRAADAGSTSVRWWATPAPKRAACCSPWCWQPTVRSASSGASSPTLRAPDTAVHLYKTKIAGTFASSGIFVSLHCFTVSVRIYSCGVVSPAATHRRVCGRQARMMSAIIRALR